MLRLLSLSALLLAAGPSLAAAPGYQFHAEGVTTGVRWGYTNLFLMPRSDDARYSACTWQKVPTAYGARYRPVCA